MSQNCTYGERVAREGDMLGEKSDLEINEEESEEREKRAVEKDRLIAPG